MITLEWIAVYIRFLPMVKEVQGAYNLSVTLDRNRYSYVIMQLHTLYQNIKYDLIRKYLQLRINTSSDSKGRAEAFSWYISERENNGF